MLFFSVSNLDRSSTPATFLWSNFLNCTAKLCISASIFFKTSSIRATSDNTLGIVVIASTIPDGGNRYGLCDNRNWWGWKYRWGWGGDNVCRLRKSRGKVIEIFFVAIASTIRWEVVCVGRSRRVRGSDEKRGQEEREERHGVIASTTTATRLLLLTPVCKSSPLFSSVRFTVNDYCYAFQK